MEEIGKLLEETRTSMEISLEEASEDLKVEPSQIEDVENGNIKAFDDLVNLKYFLKDYAKYLWLDYEEIVDEYNEFLFDSTSKISLEDIKEAKRKLERKDKKKDNVIRSPYTQIKKESKWQKYVVIASCIALLLGSVCYIIIKRIPPKEEKIENVIR